MNDTLEKTDPRKQKKTSRFHREFHTPGKSTGAPPPHPAPQNPCMLGSLRSYLLLEPSGSHRAPPSAGGLLHWAGRGGRGEPVLPTSLSEEKVESACSVFCQKKKNDKGVGRVKMKMSVPHTHTSPAHPVRVTSKTGQQLDPKSPPPPGFKIWRLEGTSQPHPLRRLPGRWPPRPPTSRMQETFLVKCPSPSPR